MQAYEQRLRSIERRAICFALCGLLCVVVSGVLSSAHPAVSQKAEPQTFRAPFRVVDSTGQVLFEIREHPYGGKMILYAKDKIPIIEASSGEMTTALVIHEGSKGGTTYVGASTKSGFLILKTQNGQSVFQKP
jgi:hypothetical protein